MESSADQEEAVLLLRVQSDSYISAHRGIEQVPLLGSLCHEGLLGAPCEDWLSR